MVYNTKLSFCHFSFLFPQLTNSSCANLAPEWCFTAAGLFFLVWVFLLATLFFFSPSHGPLLSSFLHSLSSQAFLWYLYFPPEPSSAHTDLEFSSVTRLSPSVLASHWLTSSHVTRTGGGPDCWLSSQVLVLYGLASRTCWFVGRQTVG